MKTMKKTSVILILALSMLLSACDKTEQGNSVDRPKSSVLVEPKPSNTSNISTTNTQSPAPKPTTNEGNKDDLNIIVGTLNEALKGINNKTLTHDERVGMTTRFVENLTKLLQSKESTKLSDEDLQKALDYNIVSKTKAQDIDGTSVRIVRFDGLPELFGTLERKWTYIQCWNDKETDAQVIINKGAEVVEDFLVSKTKGIQTVVLAGYLTTYKPYPVFLSTWQLRDNKWRRTNLFSKSIAVNDIWELKMTNSELAVESKSENEITVEINQQKDGFVVYSEVDQKKKIEFKFDGEEITMK